MKPQCPNTEPGPDWASKKVCWMDACLIRLTFGDARDESEALMDDKQSCSLDWSHSQQVEWLQPRAVRTGRSEQLGVL